MRRYIEAEEVEKRIDIVLASEPKAWDKKALKELKMYIVHAVPTADVRENVRGEWLKKKGSLWTLATCSVCGELSVEGDKPFCPNCGAEMRGDNNV